MEINVIQAGMGDAGDGFCLIGGKHIPQGR